MAFLKRIRRIDPARFVFLDEAGANVAMGRSHVWVERGETYVEPRPMNWGHNLTMIGAVRLTGWVTLATQWGAANTATFVTWVRDRLVPHLQPGDVVVMDNLRAHHAPAVRTLIEASGASVLYLPPYSYDFNPIEPAWALVKKYIRSFAPRTADALRRVARAARHAVAAVHCERFFAHAGYVNSTAVRD